MKIAPLPDSALERSILVVAHPDDEILWFGSIVEDVDHIIICFLDDPGSPGTGAARQRCLGEHPLRHKITCLDLPETGTRNQASWPHPEITEYGLQISGNPDAGQTYMKRAQELGDRLRPLIGDAGNIFTHNPWGEYGHAEHVLVHRVVMSIAEHAGTAIWHSNYVSGWSQPLMETYLPDAGSDYYQNEVDTAAMLELSQCYKRHDVWTWMDNYAWFPQECYIRGPLSQTDSADGGWLCPLNFVRVSSLQTTRTATGKPWFTRLAKKLARTINRIQK